MYKIELSVYEHIYYFNVLYTLCNVCSSAVMYALQLHICMKHKCMLPTVESGTVRYRDVYVNKHNNKVNK